LDEIATVLRGNARQAQKMATNIESYLKHCKKDKFERKDWNILKWKLGILPLGLNRIELQLLRVLQSKKSCSLTHLAAKMELSKTCVQRDFELHLQKNNLMEIGREGRGLTQTGHSYLKELDKEAKAC
jgi:Holliday junction resolvasome RuvABC ATP-dependent DNA helicase subunit